MPVWDRLVRILGDLPGWLPLLTLGVVGFGFSVGRSGPILESTRITAPGSPAARFRVLVLASTLVATAVLMIPAYFDTRFLLPLWPSIAVAAGGALAEVLSGLAFRPRAVIAAAFACCLGVSVAAAVGEPAATTCWAARGLIDQMVSRYGVATLANVGNITDWNVCKTGLINELRDNPGDCFVLHDLSAASAEELRRGCRGLTPWWCWTARHFRPGFWLPHRVSIAPIRRFHDHRKRPGVGTGGGPDRGRAYLLFPFSSGAESGSPALPQTFAGIHQVGGRAVSAGKPRTVPASRLRRIGETVVTLSQHAMRIGLLMAVTAGLLSWGLRHTEASFGDGSAVHSPGRADCSGRLARRSGWLD